MRNIKVLKSFVQYCLDHPEERFWQALRNWSEYSFIYGSYVSPDDDSGNEWINACLEDTFYKEGK